MLSDIQCQYTRAYKQAPVEIREHLSSIGISSTPPDGELLDELQKHKDGTYDDWAKQIMARRQKSTEETMKDPEKETQMIKEILLNLQLASATGRSLDTYSDLETMEFPTLRELDLRTSVDQSLVETAIRKWRHYKPSGKEKTMPQTQRNIERELRRKWMVMLLEYFTPHAAKIPRMQAVMHMKSPLEEYMDLFGNKVAHDKDIPQIRHEAA